MLNLVNGKRDEKDRTKWIVLQRVHGETTLFTFLKEGKIQNYDKVKFMCIVKEISK